MTPRHRRCLRALPLACLLLGVAAGCPATPPPSVVATPVAPRSVPAVRAPLPEVRFVEITQEAGLTFRHTNAATGQKYLPETMGSGAAFFDADGDHDPDLLLVNSNPWDDAPAVPGQPRPTHAFYLNDGQGHFTDKTAESGLGQATFGMGAAVGDYDNDGDADVYVTGLTGNTLFQNDGHGHFTDVTGATGSSGGTAWYTSATFCDIDRDGDLDLFACGYVAWSKAADEAISTQLLGAVDQGKAYDPPASYRGAQCLLLRNDGATFADITAEAGIRVVTPDAQAPVAKSMGVAPLDIDGDGLVDLAVANDTVFNFLFHNLGGGKFEEISTSTGVAFDNFGATRAGMGVDWADFRNDGSLALAVGNFANEMTALYVADDPKALLFLDQAHVYGLGAPTTPPLKFGLFFFDYDLDGRLDLLTANGHLESDIGKTQASETHAQAAQLFWNSGRIGREMFLLVDPGRAGPDLFRPIVGRAATYADIDADGDLDVLLTSNGGPAHLYRNDGGNRNHWLRLDLGCPNKNRDAQGARVEVTVGGVTNRRQLFTTKGYLAAVEHPLTFGLGTQDHADRIRITWPDGQTSEMSNVAANQTCRIVQGVTPPQP